MFEFLLGVVGDPDGARDGHAALYNVTGRIDVRARMVGHSQNLHAGPVLGNRVENAQFGRRNGRRSGTIEREWIRKPDISVHHGNSQHSPLALWERGWG